MTVARSSKGSMRSGGRFPKPPGVEALGTPYRLLADEGEVGYYSSEDEVDLAAEGPARGAAAARLPGPGAGYGRDPINVYLIALTNDPEAQLGSTPLRQSRAAGTVRVDPVPTGAKAQARTGPGVAARRGLDRALEPPGAVRTAEAFTARPRRLLIHKRIPQVVKRRAGPRAKQAARLRRTACFSFGSRPRAVAKAFRSPAASSLPASAAIRIYCPPSEWFCWRRSRSILSVLMAVGATGSKQPPR
jgi:hypothetical protein